MWPGSGAAGPTFPFQAQVVTVPGHVRPQCFTTAVGFSCLNWQTPPSLMASQSARVSVPHVSHGDCVWHSLLLQQASHFPMRWEDSQLLPVATCRVCPACVSCLAQQASLSRLLVLIPRFFDMFSTWDVFSQTPAPNCHNQTLNESSSFSAFGFQLPFHPFKEVLVFHV